MFIRNGLPDGYVVRLVSLEEKHFPTATRVEEQADGSIDIYFNRIYLGGYKKGEHLSHWPVVRERPKLKRTRR